MAYVYEVYKEKSFSKAARNLYISQPSLSADIKKIEQQIGYPLFDRSTNPIGLTECGSAYIKSVEKIMEIEEDFENYRNDLDDIRTGTISIGGTNLFTSFILPPILINFSRLYPQITINLVETNTSALEKRLFEGELDLVIDNFRFDPDIYSRQFFAREQLLLAVPRAFLSNTSARSYQLTSVEIRNGQHLLPDTISPVPLELFKDEPFLLLKEGNDTRMRAEKICRHNHFTPSVTLLLDQQSTAYNLTCHGMGISFISDTLIKNVQPDHGVVYYKLETPEPNREICFYYKQSRYMKKAVREFLKSCIR